MSWQETLDKIMKFVSIDKCKYDRSDKLFNEKIILDILNSKKVKSHVRKWLHEKSKVDHDIFQKDLQRAEFFRQEGNRYYLQGVNAKALELYNDSIRNYPLNSSTSSTLPVTAASSSGNDSQSNNGISLAYANRSAVFFNWKQYRKCLADIKMAFEFNYPNALKYKLLKRKAECLFNLGEFAEARITLSSAMKSIINNQAKIKGRNKIISSIEELQRKMQGSGPSDKEQALEHDGTVVKVAVDGNKVLLDASDGVKVSYNTASGRHLIAEKNFKSGDALIVENPYASAVLMNLYKSHCRHCLLKADNMVPCTVCCTQTYCSEKCRSDAWQQKHYFECGHIVKLNEVGIASVALHIVLRTDAKILLEEHVHSLNGACNNEMPFGLNNEKIRSDYKMIYNLALHTKEMKFCQLIEYATTAIALLLIMKQGKFFERGDIIQLKEIADVEYVKICQEFFPNKSNDNNSQDLISSVELLFGSLIFRHIQQLVCNGIAVTGICDILESESKISTYTQMRLGTCIYAAASLMNHSCDPNCIQTFHGSTLVIKAMKEIIAGQELTISYGPRFSKLKWEERQQILKDQYFFACYCERCKNGPGDELYICAFKCQHCEGPIPDLNGGFCSSCKKPFDGKWYHQEHLKLSFPGQKFLPPLKNGIKEIEELEKTLKMGERIYYKYSKFLSNKHNTVASMYAQLEKYPMAKYHFGKALEIEMFIHGEESIEVGHSLGTYSGLLMTCLQMKMAKCNRMGVPPDFSEVRECMSVVQKAIKILSIAYATVHNSEELQNLKQMEAYLFEMLRNEKHLGMS